MASKAYAQAQAHEDQHAYDNLLSSASTYGSFSPAAWTSRHPRRRAPESDPSSLQIHESPQSSFNNSPPSRSSDEHPLLPSGAVTPAAADAPFFRRFLGARDRPRAFHYATPSDRPPLCHVNAPQAWPPRRDSLNAPTSGVR